MDSRWSLPSGGLQARPGGGNERDGGYAYPDMTPFREVRTPLKNYGPARVGGRQVTPLARRLAGERGIDLTQIKGSGPHGRVVASDVERARGLAPGQAPAAAHIVMTADIDVTAALALRDDANAALKTKGGQRFVTLADVIIKAWAVALARVVTEAQPAIALTIGKDRLLFRNAAQTPLSAFSAVSASDEAPGASSVISIASADGIASVAGVLSPPYTTMLGIGSPRRVPVEDEDGAIKFVTAVTATLTCDERAVDPAVCEALLTSFRRFVQQPVLMIV
jgi:pyruvate dehydrogenase E2 component (dihydrolipoamide acetyltransferase)